MEVYRILGELATHRSIDSWNLVRSLVGIFSALWLCVGDFNKITKSNEKLGGRLRLYNQMKNFHDMLDEGGLMDLGFVGSKFMWFK